MEIEMDELFGLPAHPLLVHIPVVIIPLALLAAVLALWPRTRRHAALAAAALALVGAVGAVLAAGAGETLEDDVRETELVEEHVEQGDRVELPALAFGALAIAGAVTVEAARRSRRHTEGAVTPTTSPTPSADDQPRRGGTTTMATTLQAPARAVRPAAGLATALLALSVLAGAVATYTVVQAGHSGAESVWDDAPAADGD